MSSTNYTTHYSIPLPLGTDLTTPMDYNEAAEAVDTALFAAETDATNASEAAAAAVNTANAASDAVDTVAADLTQEKAKIVSLQTRMTSAENEIDDVRADSSDMITAYNEPTATAAHRYEVGDYFIYNNTLYKATAIIAIGATIVPDTNCETTNVSTELIAIKSDLSNKQNKTWTQLCYTASTTGESFAVDWSVYTEVIVCVCNATGGCVASNTIPVSLLANINTVYAEYSNSTIWGSAAFTTNQIVLQQYGGSNVLCYAR